MKNKKTILTKFSAITGIAAGIATVATLYPGVIGTITSAIGFTAILDILRSPKNHAPSTEDSFTQAKDSDLQQKTDSKFKP